jgi:hypothetical protein
MVEAVSAPGALIPMCPFDPFVVFSVLMDLSSVWMVVGTDAKAPENREGGGIGGILTDGSVFGVGIAPQIQSNTTADEQGIYLKETASNLLWFERNRGHCRELFR